jgi:hypothetical protein
MKIKKLLINSVNSILLISMFPLFTCASNTVRQERENIILKNYTEEKKVKYSDILVNPEKYTTEGLKYQDKYYRHLIGIAGEITENKKMTVAKGSIGFYFDKRSGNKKNLFLGLDIETGQNYAEEYQASAVKILKKDLKPVLETLNSCKTIFDEDIVVGMVIGWKWRNGGEYEYMNVWIGKKDVLRFEENSLTLDELVQRSFITNTSGKIIRLPL